MQDFNDILNGVTDGTKDLSINALTCAGTATFNGNVAIGNASSDTLTVTGSLISDIVPSTDGTRSLGSAALGFLAAYFGDTSGDTVKVTAATLTADRIYTLPEVSADASFVMTAGAQTIAGSKTLNDTGTGTIISKFGSGTAEAGAATNGIVTTGTQTLAGAKTFSGNMITGGKFSNSSTSQGADGSINPNNTIFNILTSGTSASTLEAGEDNGQLLILVNNTGGAVTIQRGSTLLTSTGADISLGVRGMLWAIYSTSIGRWLQISTAVNVS